MQRHGAEGGGERLLIPGGRPGQGVVESWQRDPLAGGVLRGARGLLVLRLLELLSEHGLLLLLGPTWPAAVVDVEEVAPGEAGDQATFG